MDKFTFYGHAMVVMSQDELEKVLTNAIANGYIIGHNAGHLKGYKLGKRV